MAQSFRTLLGAPPSTAKPSDSTLIIIDAQNEYAEGKLKVTNAPETRKAIASLLEKYRNAGGKIVHVVHKTPDGAPVFTPNTKLAEGNVLLLVDRLSSTELNREWTSASIIESFSL